MLVQIIRGNGTFSESENQCRVHMSRVETTDTVSIDHKFQMLFKKCFVILHGNIDLFAIIHVFSFLIQSTMESA